MIYIKQLAAIFTILTLVKLAPTAASAHIVVRPSQVAPAAWQTFTVGVPVEKDLPTVGVRLVIPAGLKHVTPNVKPGWRVETVKSGSGKEAVVTEIRWTNGRIPVGQRDEFLFSAQVPATTTELQWKAYQTYSDGSIVAWDQNPKESANHDHDFSRSGPYSVTQVAESTAPVAAASSTPASSLPLILSITALALSVWALLSRCACHIKK